ncbi:hypothetical protein FB45DRAFT_940722 [Roridomyces roridus]|uniref:Uncharacterized protein n=1 Tax=Roridomyces roridus TaxID=1738132 RepID=A0AAD7FA57_9AGAR|nr:hypothetical protein FB45DRAFT_940722 [Roridomyces roridus]
MADLLRQVSGGRRVAEILRNIEDLGQRVELATDAGIMRESGMSTEDQIASLTGMATELLELSEKVEQEKGHLQQREEWNRLKDVLESVPQAIESRGQELDQTFRLPAALEARITQDSGDEGAGAAFEDVPVEGSLDSNRAPASGVQRVPTSIRVQRDQTNASPTASSSNSTPSDSQTFDVVFIPFPWNYEIVERDGGRQKKTKLAIPDSKLKNLQRRLKKLGLVFQVTLSGDASQPVEESFARKVKRFGEERDFRFGGSNRLNWVLMKRKGPEKFTEDVPTEEESTVPYLRSLTRTSPKERALIPNYLGTGNKILLIAPQCELRCGAIQLPGTTESQAGHRCHVSRALAAIEDHTGRCNSLCPSERSEEVRPIRPHPMTSGRTLA